MNIDIDPMHEAIDLEAIDETRGMGRRTFLMGALATGAAVSAPINYAAAARKSAASPSPRTARSTSASPPASRAPSGIVLWTHLGGVKAATRSSRLARRQGPQASTTSVEERLVTARDDARLHRPHLRQAASKPARGVLLPLQHPQVALPDRQVPGRSRRPTPTRRSGSASSPARAIRPASTTPMRALAAEQRPRPRDLSRRLRLREREPDPEPTARTRPATTSDGDAQLLHEWRQKYRLYQSDEQLQLSLHANHPFVAALGRPRGRGQLRR